MTGDRLVRVPFEAHIGLLQLFLERRTEIVEKLAGLLNAQRKRDAHMQDGPLLARDIGDCFHSLTGIAPDATHLLGQLETAHRASGFEPRRDRPLDSGLFDPAEMMARGVHLWDRTRWPGRNGRLSYAQTLFNLYVLRRLALLSMRLWDAGTAEAGERLAQVQAVLVELWGGQPADQPVLVRDARWLIPIAQSPTNAELGPYFEVAARIAESLSQTDRNAIHRANVLLAGGHLRSQLRHYCTRERASLSEPAIVLNSRKSNALDFALLIQDLVPLLEAYEQARRAGDDRTRLELADAICQGISPDPELFVNRLDLLAPYTMIEHVFIAADSEGHADYTRDGRRHRQLLAAYAALLGRLSAPLWDDCRRFQPGEGTYSPYGILYGFASNLIEHMALKTLQPDGVTCFSLEDAFAAGAADKLAWVSGWRKLPHVDREVQRRFDYPQSFAEAIFARIEAALRKRAFGGEADTAPRTGHLYIAPEADVTAAPGAPPAPDLPARYVASSAAPLVAPPRAMPYGQTNLDRDRKEGYFLVSYETSGGWAAVTKDLLTEVVGAGRDANIAGLPPFAAEALKLMLPDIAVLPENPAFAAPRHWPAPERPGRAD